jgi:hypothetical protein
MRRSKVQRSELEHLVYDVIPPRIMDGRRGKARVFVLLVDEALLLVGDPAFQELMEQVNQIPVAARGTDQLVLMTYGECASIANLGSQTARLLPEFNPGLLLPTLSKGDFFSPVSGAFPAVTDFITSLAHKEPTRPSALFAALRWAAALLEGSGGRLLLFTSGKASDEEFNALSLLLSKSISLSVFKRAPISILEMWSQMTGGVVSALSNVAPLISLFDDSAMWAVSAVMRTSQALTVASVTGPCCTREDGALVAPAMGTGNALVFELAARDSKAANVLFQLAVRYTDNDGELKIRIINGRLPVAARTEPPLDDPAIALFLSRKRVFDRDEARFRALTGSLKRFIKRGSVFPACAFAGTVRDPTFSIGASVEKLLLMVLPTRVEVGGTEFRVVWAPEFTIIFPRPDEQQESEIRKAGKSLGAGPAVLFFAESEEEFSMMNMGAKEALAWFDEIPLR